MNTILISATIIFGLSSLFFFFKREKFGSDLPWLVSFITVLSYLVMIMLTQTSIDPAGSLWTRWIGYAMSCTLLTISMTELFAITGKQKLTALVSTPLIMLTGVLAAIATTPVLMMIFILLGMIPFISLITIFQKASTPRNKFIFNYLYFGWMAFPVIFILSPETFSIMPSLSIILVAYLIADVCTKIIFYIQTQPLTR